MTTIYIKYKWFDDSTELGLSSLGKSLIWIDDVITDIFRISKMKADLDIKVVKAEEWSIIVYIASNLIFHSWQIPFDTMQDLLEFLILADYSKYLEIYNALSETAFEWYQDMEAFFSNHPIAYDFVKWICWFIVWWFTLWKVAKWMTINVNLNSNQPIAIGDQHVTPYQLTQIKSTVIKWWFNNVFEPFVEDETDEFEIWTVDDNNNRIPNLIIDNNDFSNYLSDWHEVLPAFIDGNSYELAWRITAMQVSKWESMQYKTNLENKNRYLKLKNQTDNHIENYRNYFNQDVIIKAVIKRTSLFKKPTLLLSDIRFVAQPLFPIEESWT